MRRPITAALLLALLGGGEAALADPLYITCSYTQRRLSSQTGAVSPSTGIWVPFDDVTWEPFEKLEKPRLVTFSFNEVTHSGRYFDENRGYGYGLTTTHFLPDRILATNSGENDSFFINRRNGSGTWTWGTSVMQQLSGTCAKRVLVKTMF